MKHTISHLTFLVVLASLNLAHADAITCPIRPGHFDCSDKTVKIDALLPEWQVKSETNSGFYCSTNQTSYLKFMEASYDNQTNILRCVYAAINDKDQILAYLSLSSTNYTADINAMYSRWEYMTSGEDCGHIFSTSIYNCPIILK